MASDPTYDISSSFIHQYTLHTLPSYIHIDCCCCILWLRLYLGQMGEQRRARRRKESITFFPSTGTLRTEYCIQLSRQRAFSSSRLSWLLSGDGYSYCYTAGILWVNEEMRGDRLTEWLLQFFLSYLYWYVVIEKVRVNAYLWMQESV